MRATNLTRVRGFLEARFESSSSSDLRLEGVKPPVSGAIAGMLLGMVGAGGTCARRGESEGQARRRRIDGRRGEGQGGERVSV